MASFDKYAAVRELVGDKPFDQSGEVSDRSLGYIRIHLSHLFLLQSTERHIDAWTKCLTASYKLITKAAQIFGEASSSSICKEVVASEKGSSFIKSEESNCFSS